MRENDVVKINITFEENVPSLVAELADGGMRDALSILDQTIAYAGNKITVGHIRDIYGIATPFELVNFLRLCNENDYVVSLFVFEDSIDTKTRDKIREYIDTHTTRKIC